VSTWLFTIARSRIIDRRLDELELESALAEFPQLQQELESDREIVAALAHSSPLITMADNLFERLLDRIDRELDGTARSTILLHYNHNN
jgi:DNA-directed RNA polymerase specialized sigma24 family protein